MCNSWVQNGASRRHFLRLAAGGGLGALASTVLAGDREPDDHAAESRGQDLSPAAVLSLLDQGNQRFVMGRLASPHRNLDRVKEVAGKQAPIAAFLGCADSRVPIEIVFDQGFGDLFVTRVAGNVVTPEILGSLEFGTAVLGAKVLFVLGHSSCGAVSAAMKNEEVPGQISTLFQHIQPAVHNARGDAAAAVRLNVRNQVAILSESSPPIARRIKAGTLLVVGGVYDLATGQVTRLN